MKQSVFDWEDIELPILKKRVISGELIVYPTDTVYGVGTVIDKEDSLKMLYKVKGRSFSSPLIALVSDKKNVNRIAYVDKNKEKIEKLMDNFWPGALTIILDKKKNVPSIMVSGGSSIGVRMPDHPMALEIIEVCGGILATTSANISGEPSPKSFLEISKKLKEKIGLLVDGGSCPIGIESTIIDMRKEPVILRDGGIKKEDIEKIIGKF